jgi:hypothetical protein
MSGEGLERRLLASVLQAAEQATFPYDVRQADLQTSHGRTAWIVRIADPIPPLGGTDLPFHTYDVVLRWPVRMLLEALTPHVDELGEIDTFLLAISDEGRSVYDVSPEMVRGFAAGSVTEDAVLDGMGISRLAR